jgi:hypothetical protein
MSWIFPKRLLVREAWKMAGNLSGFDFFPLGSKWKFTSLREPSKLLSVFLPVACL